VKEHLPLIMVASGLGILLVMGISGLSKVQTPPPPPKKPQ